MHETIAKIGSPNPLVGVLTEPTNTDGGKTAIILLNSGVMHRVGACRLSVKIARAVALETGLLCLRFDFSGIGDSEARRASGADFGRAAVAEVVEAMDHLQVRHGIEQFILYGLCSGALIACNTAEVDARIVAIAQIDGCCYPTPKSYLSYYASRLWSVEGWRMRFFRWFRGGRNVDNNDSILLGGKADFEIPEFADDPGKAAVSTQLATLMARGLCLHCIFTGRELHYRYRTQYRDCYSKVDFGDALSLDYYPYASHIFTEPVYQRDMIAGFVGWIKKIN
ncbi:MAG: alpha/beta fold hydrolase [Cellvibrionaceae bacterium]